MTDPQWKQALELYESVAPLPAQAARALLEAATEDAEVLREVSEMLGSLREDEEPDADRPQYSGALIGRYEVIAPIGSGSTGDVYSGRDRQLSRPVALKFMSPEYASAGSGAQRFLCEARAVSAVNHPNIITVYEVITWKGRPVIVMELVEGSALRTRCGQPWPIARVVRVGSQIMQALAVAHSTGIVHRDLKPENVMIRPDGYIKVLDFGLARRNIFEAGKRNLSSTRGLPVGTLRYMSPEQCRGEPASPASDVFAAGIVLYELIAGRHPFEADSSLDTAHAIARTQPRPLAHVRPDLPASVAGLIISMLAKDAHARPSAKGVADVLVVHELSGTASGHSPASGWYVAAALVATAVLVSGLWAPPAPQRANPSSSLQPLPLASLLGAETQPSVSPDGSRVAFAFVGAKDVTSHIYVKSISGGKITRLTSDALPDFEPVFSPDGTRLAFLRRAGGRLRVMITSSAGGIAQQVGEVMDIGRKYSLMTWDLEGRHLFVVDALSQSGVDAEIFQISVDTGRRRQVTFPPDGSSDFMPAVSPDGGTLGYARLGETGRGDLWALPLGGGAERRLTNSREVFFCWSWAPGGKGLLISYRRAGRDHLWRQPIEAGPAVRVAGLDDQVRELSVARNATVMAYGSTLDNDHNVWRYVLPPSTEGPEPIIASAAFDGDPRYSPDGRRIAFASTRSGRSNIWICENDGTGLKQMTSLENGAFTAGSPNWSPNGRWIAFDARSADTESSIFKVDVLGGKPKRLTGPGPSDLVPSWSRDSYWVYFSSNRGGGALQIWKVAAEGGEPVQVTRNGGFEIFESLDGLYLYYTKRGVRSGFWRMPVEGGPETYVPELESVGNRNWESTPRGLYFVSRSTSTALALLSFPGGQVKELMTLPILPTPVHRGFSMSPDGRSFLYMQADLTKSNIMVVNNFH
jgi:serine/threonine protein kinase